MNSPGALGAGGTTPSPAQAEDLAMASSRKSTPGGSKKAAGPAAPSTSPTGPGTLTPLAPVSVAVPTAPTVLIASPAAPAPSAAGRLGEPKPARASARPVSRADIELAAYYRWLKHGGDAGANWTAAEQDLRSAG